jgi:hypothetical protein
MNADTATNNAANPRHIAEDQLSAFLKITSFPGILRDLHSQAVDKIGFFTKHATRAVEYPWAVHQMESRNAERILDVGAGVSVLPLRFASAGAAVMTVDYSRRIRGLADKNRWTEWGFLDYALVDPAIRSHNCPLSEAPLEPGSFDAFYCISVIEHTPRAMRIDLLQRAGELVHGGGWGIVTLDLKPGTRRLWNRDRGRKVEDDAIHGTLDDFLEDAAGAGWSLESCEMAESLPGAVTDVAMLVLQRSARTPAAAADSAQPRQPTKTGSGLRERFAKIYRRGGWSAGKAGSASGAGSSISYTEGLRAKLEELLHELQPKIFLDAPCGDFEWFRAMRVPEGMLYLGMDIVRELIRSNQSKFGSARNVFFAGDITADPLPKADLMLCRDCLFHLAHRDCFAFLDNFLASGTGALLLTSHFNTTNRDLPPRKGFRQINFLLPPFNFPAPKVAIEDYVEGFPKRAVCLWQSEEIRDVLKKRTPTLTQKIS